MSRRTEILRRATEVFQRQGYARTSIEDIAREVGVKREAIYYYFRNRIEILLEIILPQTRSLLLGMRNVMQAQISSRDKLRGAIENHLALFNPGYLEMAVALREDHLIDREIARLEELRRAWKEYGTHWTTLIREGQERGEFNRELNPKMVAYGILGMCNWLSRWYDPGGEVTIDEIIETYVTMITSGICVAAGDPTPSS